EVSFTISNKGRGIARHFGFFAQVVDPGAAQIVRCSRPLEDVSAHNGGKPSILYENDDQVLHPEGLAKTAGSVFIRRSDLTKAVDIRFRVYAENMSVVTQIVTLPPNAGGQAATGGA